MSKHKGVYVTPSYTKKVFANMKRPCKGFSGRVTPLFFTMMVQATEDMVADSATPTDSHSTPIITQPSSLKPQKKKSKRKQRKEVLDLEKAKTTQAKEITSLKKRVKQLEKIRKSRTSGLRRLRKVGSSSRVKSSNNASLGAQEDASKQGRKMRSEADAETRAGKIEFEKVVEEPVVSVATTTKSIQVSTAEVVTTASANQVALDGRIEMARNLEAQLQAELIEEERLARQKEEAT
ncbi:hypothetical protein Tco_1500848 [Tanacetum coccineum]